MQEVVIVILVIALPVAVFLAYAAGFNMAKRQYGDSWDIVTAPPVVGPRLSAEEPVAETKHRQRTRPVYQQYSNADAAPARNGKIQVRSKERS